MKKIIILCGVILVQAIPTYASDDSNSDRPPMNFSTTPTQLNPSGIQQDELSRMIAERNAEEDLRRAIELSMEADSNPINPSLSEDDELQRALALSRTEFPESSEDDELLRAIELSKTGFNESSEDDELQRAIELSKTGFNESSEDESLRLALEMSMMSLNNEEDSFSHHTTTTSSLNNELQNVFRLREHHHGGSFNDGLYNTRSTNTGNNVTGYDELDRILSRRRALSEMSVTNNTNDTTVNTLNSDEVEGTVEITTTPTVVENEGTLVTPTREERRRLALEALEKRSKETEKKDTDQ